MLKKFQQQQPLNVMEINAICHTHGSRAERKNIIQEEDKFANNFTLSDRCMWELQMVLSANKNNLFDDIKS